jgi:hypothetical protein
MEGIADPQGMHANGNTTSTRIAAVRQKIRRTNPARPPKMPKASAVVVHVG